MYSSTNRQKGFTLLEMIVVLLITGMISALLMQGFIYMAGIYHAVDRRQQILLSNQLIQGWLGDSVRGLVNGIDSAAEGEYFSAPPFRGDETGFAALNLHSLSNAGGVMRPIRMQWKLQRRSSGELELLYLEERSAQETPDTFTARQWPRGTGRFSYLSNGQWYSEFPLPGANWTTQDQRVLPDAIRLEVDAPRAPLYAILRPGSSRLTYTPPGREEQ